eukprot:PhM_4_TR2648/c0_g1_i2/m.76406
MSFVASSKATTPVGSQIIEQVVAEVSKSELLEVYRRVESIGSVRKSHFIGHFEDVMRRRLNESMRWAVSMMFDQADVDGDGYVTWDDISALLVDTISVALRRSDLMLFHDYCTTAAFQAAPSVSASTAFVASLSKSMMGGGPSGAAGVKKQMRWDDVTNLWYLPTTNRFAASHGKNLVVLGVNSEGTLIHIDATLSLHDTPVSNVLYISRMRRLLTIGADRILAQWIDAEKWPLAHKIKTPSALTCLCYDEDAQHLLAGATDGKLYIITFASNGGAMTVKTKVQIHSDWVMDIVVMAGHDTFATCCLDGSFKIWDRETFMLRSQKTQLDNGITRVIYSTATKTFFTTCSGRKVHVWSLFSSSVQQELEQHERPLVGVFPYPTDTQLLTVDHGGKCVVWDAHNMMVLQSVGGPDSRSPVGAVRLCAYNSDSNALLLIGSNNVAHVFPTVEQNYDQAITEPVTLLEYNFQFSLVLGVIGKKVLVWYANSGHLHALYDHLTTCDISSLTLSSQGRDVCFCNMEGTLVLANILTGTVELEAAMPEPAPWLWCVTLTTKHVKTYISESRDGVQSDRVGAYLAVSASGVARIVCTSWKAYKIILTLRTGVKPTACAYGPQSRTLVLASRSSFDVWDIESGQLRFSRSTAAAVTAMRFVGDLNTFVVALRTGSLLLYGLNCVDSFAEVQSGVKGSISSISWCAPNWRLLVTQRGGSVATIDMCPIVRLVRETLHVLLQARRRPDTVVELHNDQYRVAWHTQHHVGGNLVPVYVRHAMDTTTGTPVCMHLSPALPKSDIEAFKARLALTEGLDCVLPVHDVFPAPDNIVVMNRRRSSIHGLRKQLAGAADSSVHIVVRGHYTDAVFEYFDEKRTAVVHDPLILIQEIHWMARCLLEALVEIHSRGLAVVLCATDTNVALYHPVVISGTHWRLSCPDGLRNIGDVVEITPSFPTKQATPEMAKKTSFVATPQMDMWQFGLILYEVLTGRSLLPIGISLEEVVFRYNNREATTFAELMRASGRHSDSTLTQLVINCLQKDPSKRPTAQSALNFLLAGHSHVALPAWALAPTFPKVGFDDQEPCVLMNEARTRQGMACYAPDSTSGMITCAVALQHHPLFLSSTWDDDKSQCFVRLHKINSTEVVGTIPKMRSSSGSSSSSWEFTRYRFGDRGQQPPRRLSDPLGFEQSVQTFLRSTSSVFVEGRAASPSLSNTNPGNSTTMMMDDLVNVESLEMTTPSPSAGSPNNSKKGTTTTHDQKKITPQRLSVSALLSPANKNNNSTDDTGSPVKSTTTTTTTSKQKQQQQDPNSREVTKATVSQYCPFFSTLKECGFKQPRECPFYMKGTKHEEALKSFPNTRNMKRWNPKSEPTVTDPMALKKRYTLNFDDYDHEDPQVVEHKKKERILDMRLGKSTQNAALQLMHIAPVDRSLLRKPLSRQQIRRARGQQLGLEVVEDDAGANFRVSDALRLMAERENNVALSTLDSMMPGFVSPSSSMKSGGGGGGGSVSPSPFSTPQQQRRTTAEYLSMTTTDYSHMRQRARVSRDVQVTQLLQREQKKLREEYGGAVQALFNQRRRSFGKGVQEDD